MPGGDRTGPMGWGPMTGRGMGRCAGYTAPGYMNTGFGGCGAGRGFRPWGGGRGRAWGGGRGRGRGWFGGPGWGAAPFGYGPVEYAPQNREEEKRYVSEEIKALQDDIAELKKYLAELEQEKEK